MALNVTSTMPLCLWSGEESGESEWPPARMLRPPLPWAGPGAHRHTAAPLHSPGTHMENSLHRPRHPFGTFYPRSLWSAHTRWILSLPYWAQNPREMGTRQHHSQTGRETCGCWHPFESWKRRCQIWNWQINWVKNNKSVRIGHCRECTEVSFMCRPKTWYLGGITLAQICWWASLLGKPGFVFALKYCGGSGKWGRKKEEFKEIIH